MPAATTEGDAIRFAADAEESVEAVAPWKVLIVDDDDEVHRVTKLALDGFLHFGRSIAFVHAYSGAEAVRRMREDPDIALVLMDVVMESEHAGLDAALAIRHELKNHLARIVIRTGQPGQAPEELVIRHYGVNDYKEKTEITARKLHTLVHSGLSMYRELATLHLHKQGLECVIGAAAAIQTQRTEQEFAKSALARLAVLLYGGPADADGLLTQCAADAPSTVLAGIGRYGAAAGQRLDQVTESDLRSTLEETMRGRSTVYGARHFMATLGTGGSQLLMYVAGPQPISPADARHVSLLCRNIAVGYENLRLTRELRESQRNLILLLSTAIEQRVHAGGGHGQRVATYARLFGELLGLPEASLEELPLAATLHDVGLIAIPEAIINKAAPMTADERALYETHTRWGQDLLWSQDSDMLRTAGLVAGQHHECWDGSGYPGALVGEQIHLHARITTLSDAFEELMRPPRGRAQPLSGVIAHLERERARTFDPMLVGLLLKNIDRFTALARGPR
jgi:response regulator RpfG family c-di-GMP phosphodiesterase